MQLIGHLLEAAEMLGKADALGMYPTEELVFEAALRRAGRSQRPIVVSDIIVSRVADAYDEGRKNRIDPLELHFPELARIIYGEPR